MMHFKLTKLFIIIIFIITSLYTSSIENQSLPPPALRSNSFKNLQTKISSIEYGGKKKFLASGTNLSSPSLTLPPLVPSSSVVSKIKSTSSTEIIKEKFNNDTLTMVDVQKAKNDSGHSDSYGHNINEHLYRIGSIFTWSALLIIQIEMIAIFLIVYLIYKTIKKFPSVNQPTRNVEIRRRSSLPVSTSFINYSPRSRIEPNLSVGDSPTRFCPFRSATQSPPGEEVEMAVVRQNSNENNDFYVPSPHFAFNVDRSRNIQHQNCSYGFY